MALFSRRSHQDDRSARDQGWEAYQRGAALFEQRRWVEAAQEFARASEFVPDSVHSRLSRASALGNAGRIEEALEVLQPCLESHPEYAEVHNSLAMVLGKLGRQEEAVIHLVRAVRLEHPQAVETMRKLNMDYCRECYRPVYRTPLAQDADIRILERTVGMECTNCHEVFCIPCLEEAVVSLLLPPCLRCGGGLAAMDLENR
jgi:tetratricopeptide (TPR) repeat protein